MGPMVSRKCGIDGGGGRNTNRPPSIQGRLHAGDHVASGPAMRTRRPAFVALGTLAAHGALARAAIAFVAAVAHAASDKTAHRPRRPDQHGQDDDDGCGRQCDFLKQFDSYLMPRLAKSRMRNGAGNSCGAAAQAFAVKGLEDCPRRREATPSSAEPPQNAEPWEPSRLAGAIPPSWRKRAPQKQDAIPRYAALSAASFDGTRAGPSCLGIGRNSRNSMNAATAMATTVQKLNATSPVARPPS